MVTEIVCGASTAFGSLTVTKPVYSPRARDPACKLILICAPDTLARSHDAEEAAFRFSVPSPALLNATAGGAVEPPAATTTGPTAVCASRNWGAVNAVPIVNRKTT